MKKILLSLLFFLSVAVAYSQTAVHSVYYGKGEYRWTPDESFLKFIGSLQCDSVKVQSVRIDGFSSPSGKEWFNRFLSERRAMWVARIMRDYFPLVPMRNDGHGEDWSSLPGLLGASSLQEDERALVRASVFPELSGGAPLAAKSRKDTLLSLDGGRLFGILSNELFPALQRTDISVEYEVKGKRVSGVDKKAPLIGSGVQSGQDRTDVLADVSGSLSFDGTAGAGSVVQFRRVSFALRTNLLVPLTNIGVVVPLGERLSVGADWYSPWFWHDRANSRCMELQAADVELRWWFRSALPEGYHGNALLGHSLAFGLFGGHYDVERNWKGTQGELYGGYLDYSYSFRLCGVVRMEMGVALGYARLPYRKYEVFTSGGKLIRTRPVRDEFINWIGPVKAFVSLALPIEATCKVKEDLGYEE